MGCHFLLQGIFPIQGSNPGLQYCRQILYQLSHKGSPPKKVVYSHFESESHPVVSNSLWPHGLYSPWNSPGENARMGSFSLLQRIFPTQGSNPGLQYCRWILYQLSHREAQPLWDLNTQYEAPSKDLACYTKGYLSNQFSFVFINGNKVLEKELHILEIQEFHNSNSFVVDIFFCSHKN